MSPDRAAPPVAGEPLFLLDYDGTLAPITGDPARAFPHPRAQGLLEGLSARFPLWLLTGRSVADLARLVRVAGVRVIGVHGLEEGLLDGDGGALEVRSRLGGGPARLLQEVRAALPPLAGVRVEDKGSAIALHYRGAADPGALEAALGDWARGLPAGVEAVRGKMVFEVRPRGFDKGAAAQELASGHPGTTPVVIGDDTTDEDAFRALGEGAVSVKVGEGETLARFRLPSVEAVVAYLERYLG